MKKITLLMLAFSFVLPGCASAPQTTAPEAEEEVAAKPAWVAQLEADRAKRAEERKKQEEELQKVLAEKKAAEPAKKETNQPCQINGYDCWKVAQLFKLGTENDEEARNTKLKKMGLSVTFSTMYRDGGSWDYQLSDGTRLHVTNSLWDRSGDIKIRLSDGKLITYDDQGHQKPNIQ